MSLSGLVEQDYLSKLAVLQTVIAKYHPRWVVASTQEDRLSIEAEALDKFFEIIEDDLYYSRVSEFHHPDVDDFTATYQQYELVQKSNSSRIRRLMEMFLLRENTHRLQAQDLLAQVRRIKQKHATLNLWNNEKVKFFTGNKFENISELNDEFTSVEPAEVHTTQGVLSLPVQTRERVEILGVKIGPQSNGVPGNSDQAVTVSNQDPRIVLQESDNWFEYERLDAGPCRLTLNFELPRPQIINSIKILPANIGVPLSFRVSDIVFTSSTKQSIPLSSLLPEGYSDDIFDIPAGSYQDGWELLILPVEAISVSISLVQTQSYSITSTGVDGSIIYRDRYVVPVQQVMFNRLRYRQTGGINSVAIPIRSNLYAMEPVLRVNPDNTSLYDLALEVSFDGGTTWKEIATDDNESIIPIESKTDSFVWRLTVSRLEEAFQNFTSFFQDEQPAGKIKNVLRSVSRFSSPTTISLNSKPADERVYAIQPKVARRGDKHKSIRIGVTGNHTNALRMPLNVLQAGIRLDSVRLYASGTEMEAKQAGEVLTGFQWSFSDDYTEILIPSDVDAGTPIYMSLDDEIMSFEQRSDGYYHQMNLAFDPDKNNISIMLLAREPSRASVLLDRDKTVINLGHKNIYSDSFQLISANGTTWTVRPNRSFVYDNPDNDYWVDYENGILYLASAVGDDSLRASYNYQPGVDLTPDQYEIIYLDGKPWGIKVLPTAFEAISAEETISDNLKKIISIKDGSYGERTEIISGASNKKQLSYEAIVRGTFFAPVDLLENELIPEEVEYVDGITEFLGLTQIQDERTVAITSDSNGVVQFALSARNLWYRDMGVSFGDVSVFADERNNISQVTSGSAGDYYIDDDGIVYVQLGGSGLTLRSGILISYYYKDPAFEPANKYSVDYDMGILYSYADLNQDAVISYKSALYKVSYDIAKELTDVTYSPDGNSVQVNTEVLDPINNQVKIIWTEDTTPKIDATASQYFSPLISLVGFRFS